ncbi:DKNYY domain-containing protein, partial [Candidatus Vampirococcus lugosii]|nr:membrane protein [Candidatus Vampirococcus lugosii]
KEYYNLMEKGELKKAFEMRLNSNIDLETFKSWYKELESTEVKNIRKDDDKYNFNVILEFEDKTKEKYEVVSKVKGDKIENISSEKVSILYEELGSNYHIEDNFVYFNGEKIEGADPNTFEVYQESWRYARDKNNVYKGNIKKNINPNTFTILGDDDFGLEVYKKKNNIYCRGELLKKLNTLDENNIDIIKAYRSFYLIINNNVYLGCEKLNKVEGKYFKVFQRNTAYSKDKNYVYYWGVKIDLAHPDTFEILEYHPVDIGGYENRYAKDKNYVYKYGEILDGLDAGSFEIFKGTRYSRDKNNVYFRGEKIEGADPDTFGYLYEGYAKDKNNVYHRGEIQEDKDPENYESFGGNYYSYDGMMYYKENVLKISWNEDPEYVQEGYSTVWTDPREFEHIDGDYGIDQNYIYFENKPIKDSDPDTFEVFKGTRYSRDKNNVYFRGEKIKGSDPETFEIFKEDSDYTKDKYNVYYEGKIQEDKDPETFEP